jgi:hypothetical protein
VTDTQKKRSRRGPIAVLVVVALLVLYPLSEGPARYFVLRRSLPESALNAYQPCNWVAGLFPNQRYRSAYLMWWMEMSGRCPGFSG